MKWLSTKLVNGFFILLPVLIAYLMFGQLFDALLALTAPVADALPLALFTDEFAHRLSAGVALVVLFMLVGILAGTRVAQGIGRWFERMVLGRFPPYSTIKMLSSRLAGKAPPAQLQPALLSVSPGIQMLVSIVEELPDGRLTVFVPITPTPGVGHLQIVSAEKVERLAVPMSTALGWVLNWGSGTEALLAGRPSATEAEQKDG